ncbi:MAG: Ig-like domain-containing protein [Candidatus Poribacteria bacterium]
MKFLYIVMLGIVFIYLGCGGSDNNPPIIENIIVSKSDIVPGEEVTIDVVANDPDGDSLTYSYETETGEIIGSEKSIQWKPNKEGIYVIKVTVCDSCKNKTQSSVTITVKDIAAEFPIMVNIQVTEYKDTQALQKVMNELESRGIKKTTVFVGKEFAEKNCSLVQDIDINGHEVAAFGYKLNEKGEFVLLATLSASEQEEIIKGTKDSIENCLGHRINGFRSQRFSQNKDTNEIVKKLKFSWHGSFVSGSVYLPEHKDDVVPFYSNDYGFYVVPMIGIEVQPGRISALCDTALNSVVSSPAQWKDLVKANLVKKSKEKLPFLTEFHPYFLVANPEYWNNFIELLDWLKKQNVVYVTTMELAKAYCIPCHEG